MSLPGDCVIEKAIPLAPFTSWQVGGPADLLAQPKSLEDLKAILRWAGREHLPVTVLGGGTNVLISDRGVRGLTIALRKLTGLQSEIVGDRLKLRCLSGTSKSDLLKVFLKHKLEPSLFLAGLPGDVGGGVVMNAGVGEQITPREFHEIVDWVDVIRWQGEEVTSVRHEAASLKWDYRHCQGWQPGIVSEVGISWSLSVQDDILVRVRAANQLRFSKQPLDLPSCGSVFVNPPGDKAGRLIESAGLKGYAVGGAKVSEKHANFIVNFSRATAVDIDSVIRQVHETVLKSAGVNLRTEVVYLGEWS